MDYVRTIENETSVKKIGVIEEPKPYKFGIANMLVGRDILFLIGAVCLEGS